jgi:putative ABC transport system permease protein
MSIWSRIANVFRADRLSREIDEEMQAHVAEAIEQGRDPGEARRAFGSMLRQREESRDVRLMVWLDSLRADAVFGWRQLKKKKITSAAAILSLALAIGACTSAFRLIDALLLRPLPVADPDRLYSLARQGTGPDGRVQSVDVWAYPSFQLMRAAVKDQAELIAISEANRTDLTYGSDQDVEKVYLQHVSGWMFSTFGLRPTLGRLLEERDDLKPGAHPLAVLSHDYWSRRFGRDPKVIGRTFRMDSGVYEIIGVGPEGFTGTETGLVTDIFVPAMMHAGAVHGDWTWHRILAQLKPGVPLEPFRARLEASSRAFEEERMKAFTGMSKQSIDKFLDQKLVVEPAAAGASALQNNYRRSLIALGVLVALVLLIACANVANLMVAQAAARAREMALRVSIGAGRWRLVQLVMMESAWLALLAAAIGGLFAWWSSPFVVSRINPADNPARLALPADWRVLGFGFALTLGVIFLFGLAPALRASSVKPASALKGGDDPHSRGRLMHALIAVQVAFCFLVLFVAGLFVATFDRLSNESPGFSADRLLTIETLSPQSQPMAFWDQVEDRLRSIPGVEAVALAGWPLLHGGSWNGLISVGGAPPGPELAQFLNVSPGWLDVMKIPLMDGRDFRLNDTSPRTGSGPGAAIINQTFAREFFGGENPIGKWFAKGSGRYQVVGLVRDARYRDMREPFPPVVYVPIRSTDEHGAIQPRSSATFIVRTTSNPLALASILRREVPRARPEFRVTNALTQTEINQSHTMRERLLAMLALFFATVALVLAGVGLYGVLDYSVLQRRREIGIRIAIGARAGAIARLVTFEVFSMVFLGALAGLALGIGLVRYIETLLYGVNARDLGMLAVPAATMVAVALLAAVPAVMRAVRIDPVTMLRAE